MRLIPESDIPAAAAEVLERYNGAKRAALELAVDALAETQTAKAIMHIAAVRAVALGVPLTEVADALDVSRPTVYKWQNAHGVANSDAWADLGRISCAPALVQRYARLVDAEDASC